MYGVLATDCPHQLKASAVVHFPFGTSVGVQAFAASGVPRTRAAQFVPSEGGIDVFYRGRNSDGRLPVLRQLDLYVQHQIHAGPRWRISVNANIINLFNGSAATTVLCARALPGPGDRSRRAAVLRQGREYAAAHRRTGAGAGRAVSDGQRLPGATFPPAGTQSRVLKGLDQLIPTPLYSCGMNRRTFLLSAGAAAAAAAVPDALAGQATSTSPQKARFRTGLVAYSYRELLQKKAMTYEDLIRIAVETGTDGIDLTVYWLAGDDRRRPAAAAAPRLQEPRRDLQHRHAHPAGATHRRAQGPADHRTAQVAGRCAEAGRDPRARLRRRQA